MSMSELIKPTYEVGEDAILGDETLQNPTYSKGGLEEILPTPQLQALIRHHRWFVKFMPFLGGSLLLVSLSFLSLMFHLKTHLFLGFPAFIMGLFLGVLMAGLGCVLLICYISMGLGKFNQELWLISDITNTETEISKYQCKDKLLFLRAVYKMLGEVIVYTAAASVGLVAWCVKDSHAIAASKLYSSVFWIYVVVCVVVASTLFIKNLSVKNTLENLFK